VPEIWNAAHAAGKTQLWVPLGDPSATSPWSSLVAFFRQPMTVPALFFALIVGRAAQYTTDQTMALRIQSTRSTRDARRAFIVNAAGDALWMLGLTFVGLALFAYFQHSPPPEDLASDRMLPYFMANVFPAGTVGLVTAAILAASLSSVDAAIHSGSSVLVVDIYSRLIKGRRMDRAAAEAKAADIEDDRAQVRSLRLATVIMGVMGTALATNVEGIGSLLEIANKLINSFTGPLFGIFLLAMFSKRATSNGALAGGLAGAVAAYLVAYRSSIGFLWPSTFGLAATLLVGATCSPFSSPPPDEVERYTWRGVMRRSAD
jgi:solute:Na+ symporter, SSS family